MGTLLGLAGSSPALWESLTSAFTGRLGSAGGNVDTTDFKLLMWPGHGNREACHVNQVDHATVVAVLGTVTTAWRELASSHFLGSRLDSTINDLADRSPGPFNCVVSDATNLRVTVSSDPSGLLPIYYTSLPSAFIFSSNLHLLAMVAAERFSRIGLLQFVTTRYSIGNRTIFQGIRQARAGEELTYHIATQEFRSRVRPRFFQRLSPPTSDEELADAVWGRIVEGCRLAAGLAPVGLMLSGGLDSRMVAAGLQASGVEGLASTFGQEGFHEVKIAERVANLSGLPHHFIDMDRNPYIPAPDELEDMLILSGTTFFPMWRQGAESLAQSGALSATSGLGLDATLGGHFWDLASPTDLTLRRLRSALMWSGKGTDVDLELPGLRDIVESKLLRSASGVLTSLTPLLTKDFAASLKSDLSTLRETIREEFAYLAATGTDASGQMIARYLVENHVRKFSFSQESQLRSRLPVVLPTFTAPLIQLLSEVHPGRLIDHRLYLRMVRRCTPRHASIPYSASALPPRLPGFALEMGRLYRNRYDLLAKRLLQRSRGRVRIQRYGALSFELVARNMANLDHLRDTLVGFGESRYLSTVGITRRIDQIRSYERTATNLVELTALIPVRIAEGFF